MADKQLTKDSQARVLRGWIFGLHATFIIDVGGRLGYFAELRRRGGSASAQELATGVTLICGGRKCGAARPALLVF